MIFGQDALNISDLDEHFLIDKSYFQLGGLYKWNIKEKTKLYCNFVNLYDPYYGMPLFKTVNVDKILLLVSYNEILLCNPVTCGEACVFLYENQLIVPEVFRDGCTHNMSEKYFIKID